MSGLPLIRSELRFAVWVNEGEASEVLAVFRVLPPAQEYAQACRARRDELGGKFGVAVSELAEPAVAVIEWAT